MKRLFDVIASVFTLCILLPFLLVCAVVIVLDSKGGIFYRQMRVGQYGRHFGLYKFRTMRPGSDKKGLLTVGGRDPRITRTGHVLRRYKLDELPQLLNIIQGDMSVVGPRPEVPKYVALYNEGQRQVLSVRPGLTDFASLQYFDEDELLAASDDPEYTYIHDIMPRKTAVKFGIY